MGRRLMNFNDLSLDIPFAMIAGLQLIFFVVCNCPHVFSTTQTNQ